jgi:hypothetical protein
MPTPHPPVDWLLQGSSWIAYRTRRDLLGQPESDKQVDQARTQMLADAQIQALVAELANWPGVVISSHKSAGQPFHKLTFLADLGFKASDPGMETIITRVMQYQSAEGPFGLPMNICAAYGGTGQDTNAWALCDAPLLLYALVKFGMGEDPRIRKGVEYLAGLIRDNGWPCVVSKELGSFRGPGKKEDPCPFATLAMLKLVSVVNDLYNSTAAHMGIETLLSLWEHSQTRHPYIFYMGDDFRKIKVPFIWYDLVHVLDVLSQFAWVKSDPRFQDMLSVLTAKMDPEGHFTLESAWQAWKDWEFGQKKFPSRWLTLVAWRILMHMEKG